MFVPVEAVKNGSAIIGAINAPCLHEGKAARERERGDPPASKSKRKFVKSNN